MAVDMNLVADIRAGTVTRHTLMTISNAQATVRVWSGRGELTVDGDTYGSTDDDMISISGLSDTAILQSHEVEIVVSIGAARNLGLVGFEARSADAEIKTIFLAKDGSVRDFRKIKFKGKIQSSRASASLNAISVSYKARPPLLDLARDRMTRYTTPDQARRFGSADTGFDDVPSLVNKQPVEWSPSATGAGGIVNIGWEIIGGIVVLTDSANRPVNLIGTAEDMIAIECGSTDRLGLIDGLSTTALARSFHSNPNPGWSESYLPATQYRQLGYGSVQQIIGTNTVNGGNTWLLDFIGIDLNADGFLHADGERLVVNNSNNLAYSHDGFAIVQMNALFVNGYAGPATAQFASPAPHGHCTDIDQTFNGTNQSIAEVWASFDASQYLQAQVQ